MLLDTFLVFLLIVLLLCCAFWTYLLVYLLYYRVPLISTGKNVTQTALDLAQIKPGEQVVDLGCGWSPFLFAAYSREPGAHYTGYDVLWPVLAYNRWRAKGRIKFEQSDFFKVDLSQTDVVYCYLWDTVMQRLYEEKWPTLKPGTRLVSYDFPIKNLESQQVVAVGKGKVYLYVKG